jgi:transcriptional regulator with XRE-family HTH domain
VSFYRLSIQPNGTLVRMEQNHGLGASIRDARTAAGLSQQQLADALGVNLKTAGQWERTGLVPPLRMAKLRQVLPALSGGDTEGWTAEPTNSHLLRFSTVVPLNEAPLARLHRLRRELSRITLELDECLEELERGQS